jgi:hypothetical protein
LEYHRVIPKQPFAFHSDSWISATTSDCRSYALQKCRTYVCSATTKPVLLVAQQHICLHVEQSNQKKQIHVVGGYVHSSGRLVTRLTAYHISRHVASTFKRLATATTHCDLNKFINTDGVSS